MLCDLGIYAAVFRGQRDEHASENAYLRCISAFCRADSTVTLTLSPERGSFVKGYRADGVW